MARRDTNVFSLSFLDVMSCGFGAVVLIFLIINHASQVESEVINQDLLAEIRLLDYQVQNGEKDLVELKEELEALLRGVSESDEQLNSTKSQLDERTEDLAELEEVSLARIESLEQLKSDVESREEELKRLKAIEAEGDGAQIRTFTGDGDRQYLTGLKVGGKHILIAVDTSASMLDEDIVNVLRRRNMPDERKLKAPKWQRAVRTVEWIAAQLPLDASFQIYGFNETTSPMLEPTEGEWIELGEGRELDDALDALKDVIPEKGTSLENLALAMTEMEPPPDNVYLIIDSLPTMGTREPRGATVSGRARLDHFQNAARRIPAQVPINVIMFPMEGDPMAAAAYWNLARTSGGSFLAPSRDWP
ncbi:MAG: VWA domain-containing protein [Pseudomonadota bacterium]